MYHFTNTEIMYALAAVMINNLIIAVIIIVNMRRIVEYMRTEVEKLQVSNSNLFEHFDTYIGLHNDALNLLDENVDNLTVEFSEVKAELSDVKKKTASSSINTDAQKIYNVANTATLKQLTSCVQNINAHVAACMRAHTQTINELVTTTEQKIDEKTLELSKQVADIPNWAVYYITPLRDGCVKISRGDIHKYSKLNLCHCSPRTELNLSNCNFENLYVNLFTFSLLNESKSTNVNINNLDFVLNFNCNIDEISQCTVLKNKKDIICSSMITQHDYVYLLHNENNIIVNNINIVIPIIPYDGNFNNFISIINKIISYVKLCQNLSNVNIKLNSKEYMLKQLKRKYNGYDHITEADCTNIYNAILNYITTTNIKSMQIDCEIPYDYAHDEMRS